MLIISSNMISVFFWRVIVLQELILLKESSGTLAVAGPDTPRAANYLRRMGRVFTTWVDSRFGPASFHATNDVRTVVADAIEAAIVSELPDRELSEMGQTLNEVVHWQNMDNVVSLPLGILASSGDQYIFDLWNFEGSSNWDIIRFLDLVFRLGMSQKEMLRAIKQMPILGFPQFPNRLYQIESQIDSYFRGNFDASKSNQIAAVFGRTRNEDRFRSMSAEILTMDHLFTYMSRESIEIWSRLWVAPPRGTLPARSILEAFEILVQLTRENVGLYSEHLGMISRAARQASTDYNSAIKNLAKTVAALKEVLSGSNICVNNGAFEEMQLQLNSASTMREVTVFLLPKLNDFIKFACLVHINPEPLALLKTLIQVSVSILRDGTSPQRMNFRYELSSFIDSLFDNNFSEFAHSTGSSYQAYVIKFAYILARKLRFKLLAEHPQVLPGWSPEKIQLVQKIINSFLFENGPYDWESNEVFVALSRASESRLRESVNVVAFMNAQLHESTFLSEAPLFTPGLWLREFLNHPTPTPYAALIQGFVKRPYFAGQLRNALFPEFRQVLIDHFEIPQRFFDMANRFNSFSLANKGTFWIHTALEIASKIPAQILRVEMNANILHKTDSLVVSGFETFMMSFLPVVRVLVSGGRDEWPRNKKGVMQCAKSLSGLAQTLERSEIVDHTALLAAMQGLTTQMGNLAAAIRARTVFDHTLCVVN